jgi:hypothetical protein
MPSYHKDSLMYRVLDILEEGVLSWEIVFKKLELQELHYKGISWLSKEKFKQKWSEVREGEKRIDEIQQRRRERIRFSKILSKLKQDGLITEKSKNNQFCFSLTKKGEEKRQKFITKITKEGSEWRFYNIPKYVTKPSNQLVVVVFDISEKYKRKRNWLCHALMNMGFVLLQKSVWMAKCKLPKKFMDDLRELEILSNVVIFSVAQSGNINFPEKNLNSNKKTSLLYDRTRGK